MATSKQDDDEEVVTINGANADDLKDIEVVDDTPEADRGRKPLNREVKDPDDEELATYSAGVKQRFSELTHARHDERRAREAAERERDEATRAAQALLQQNRQLQQRTTTGETHLVAASKAAAETALTAARAEMKAAKEAFDPDAEMAAQEKMMEAKLQLRELARYRPAPVQKAEDVVELPAASTPEAPADQKTLRWQARNQWFGTEGNEEMTSFALGFHQKLVKSGVDPRSDEYFSKVDGRLREVFPDFFGDTKDVEVDTTRSTQRTAPRASPVTPASRSANGVTKVRLTQTQLALAKKFGLTPQQYAQEVVRLEQK
ncbi:MAG TPA: hypothetical protein VJR90_01065 [Gammaproteobacteria bacterium]|nr:hypothetical protein [Gammaproteobacteria bacterium]